MSYLQSWLLSGAHFSHNMKKVHFRFWPPLITEMKCHNILCLYLVVVEYDIERRCIVYFFLWFAAFLCQGGEERAKGTENQTSMPLRSFNQVLVA